MASVVTCSFQGRNQDLSFTFSGGLVSDSETTGKSLAKFNVKLKYLEGGRVPKPVQVGTVLL